ncbi:MULTISPECIES: hypothetical protein [unclassified Wenzhouxiangella]|uniref:hypothetical protein n=1 Tax=unclassified Wenzhouxiangella TaxID=2613841 RepID=UPI000E327C94|nr:MULTISPECIES: hypothetical protein [unclassified Wenzhouxiangella]RFF28313.1 hypothetical protein DZK25_03445 [Wenzhouxiangella sp. 15181]RFP67762.1 hypothetical protein DZK26_11190 [Wenzhouxiangella sp. 15190]
MWGQAYAQPLLTVGDIDGGDGDCDYAYQNLQDAINAVESMPAGDTATIRLAVPDGFTAQDLVIGQLQRDLRIIGGFQSCADDQPLTGDPTTIRLLQANEARLLTINANLDPSRRKISLENLLLDGQGHDNGVGLGGLVHISGSVHLLLDNTTLENGRVSAVESNPASGGAVYLGVDTRLETQGRTIFRDNRAAIFGGAIACGEAGAHIELGSSSFRDNQARSGGAIALTNGCEALRLYNGSGPTYPRHIFAGNTAALSGGAIFSLGTEITTGDPESLAHRHLSIHGGSAEEGGAIYIAGDASAPIELNLGNTSLRTNNAGDTGGALHLVQGVQARIGQQSETEPGCPGSAGISCSWHWRNHAGASSELHGGGFAYLDNGGQGNNGLPYLLLERVHLEDNGSDGEAAVAHLTPGSRMVMHNSLVSDRIAGGGDYLFTADSANSMYLMYNTFADLNEVAGIRSEGDMEVHVVGGIYWNGDDTLWEDADGQSSLTHGDCLLSSTTTNLPNAGSVITADPMFDENYFLQPGSPAVNICDDRDQVFLGADAMNTDIKFEQRGTLTPNHTVDLGPYDLGAAALFVNDLFSDRFEQTP